jgi:hypothetical protein
MEQIRYLFVRALIKNVTLSGIKEKMFLQNIMFFRKIFLREKIYLGHDRRKWWMSQYQKISYNKSCHCSETGVA